MADKFYVYKITCLENNKLYFGKTKNPNTRWYKHYHSYDYNSFYLQNAIKKYGKERFFFEIIEEFDDEINALNKEIEYIARYKTNVNRYGKEFGYNLTDGGDGTSGHSFVMNEETKEKISQALKRFYKDNPNPMLGRHQSDEAKDKISKANKGKVLSEDHKKKLSEDRIGEKHWNYNKPSSIETRQRISEAHKGREGKRSEEMTQEHLDRCRKNMENTDLTPIAMELRKTVIELYDTGLHTKQAIANKLGIKLNTVITVIRKRNKPIFGNRIPQDLKDEVIKLKQQGSTYKEIAKRLNIPYNRVDGILKEYYKKQKAKPQ
jgi:group I intron endonuclease